MPFAYNLSVTRSVFAMTAEIAGMLPDGAMTN